MRRMMEGQRGSEEEEELHGPRRECNMDVGVKKQAESAEG